MAMTMTGMSPTELDLRRERALSIVPRVSGSLSMLGSIIVALKVIQNIRKGNGKSYSYIILTMCAIDFCSSLAFAFSTLPMEQGMARKFGQSYRYGAQGTEGTCKAQVSTDLIKHFTPLKTSLVDLTFCRFRTRSSGFFHPIRDYDYFLELLLEPTLPFRCPLENEGGTTKEICVSWYHCCSSHWSGIERDTSCSGCLHIQSRLVLDWR